MSNVSLNQLLKNLTEGYCPARDDEQHCNCWWDGERCCAGGFGEKIKTKDEK